MGTRSALAGAALYRSVGATCAQRDKTHRKAAVVRGVLAAARGGSRYAVPRHMKRYNSILPLVLILTSVTVASAKPGYNGYSGLTAGKTCGDCHSGGAKPVVSLKSGPVSLLEGQTGQYTVTVAGSLARTEIDVAASDNNGAKLALVSDNTTTKISGGEAIPISNFKAGASADYTFSVTAPKGATAITLYALGLASNGNGTGGDGEDAKTFKVTVTSGTPVDAGVAGPDASVLSDAGNNGDGAVSGDAAVGGEAGIGSGDAGGGSSGSTGDTGAAGTNESFNEEDPLGASSDTGCSSSTRARSGSGGVLIAIALILAMRSNHSRVNKLR